MQPMFFSYFLLELFIITDNLFLIHSSEYPIALQVFIAFSTIKDGSNNSSILSLPNLANQSFISLLPLLLIIW